jgi:hypothetical protein
MRYRTTQVRPRTDAKSTRFYAPPAAANHAGIRSKPATASRGTREREREREIGESEIAPALPRLPAGLSVLLRNLFEWDWVLAWAWLAPKVFMHTDPRTNTAVREETCVNSPCILFFFSLSLSRELNCISGFSCVKRQASRFWCQIKALLDDGGLFGGPGCFEKQAPRGSRPLRAPQNSLLSKQSRSSRGFLLFLARSFHVILASQGRRRITCACVCFCAAACMEWHECLDDLGV